MTIIPNLAWRSGSFIAGVVLVLSGCVPATTADQAQVEANKRALEEAAPGSNINEAERPEVAFLIEGDLYAVPLAVDENGCEQFTTWSETGVKSLAQPIYFLDGLGSFSPTKLEDLSCNARMVKTGVDGSGCPTFHAMQPDGTSSEVSYYPAGNGYTVNRERSTCG